MRKPLKKPVNTDEYLALLPAVQRTALERLRTRILSAARDAEEHFGYGLPGFKYKGHPLIYFGAAKDHCALYGSVPPGFQERLKGFAVSKGTIRFTPEKPLPAVLVKEIVKAKMLENEMLWGAETRTAAKKRSVKK